MADGGAVKFAVPLQPICRFVRDHSLITHFYRPTSVGAGFYSARLAESRNSQNTGRAESCPYAV